jgi:hypothetical protein
VRREVVVALDVQTEFCGRITVDAAGNDGVVAIVPGFVGDGDLGSSAEGRSRDQRECLVSLPPAIGIGTAQVDLVAGLEAGDCIAVAAASDRKRKVSEPAPPSMMFTEASWL